MDWQQLLQTECFQNCCPEVKTSGANIPASCLPCAETCTTKKYGLLPSWRGKFDAKPEVVTDTEEVGLTIQLFLLRKRDAMTKIKELTEWSGKKSSEAMVATTNAIIAQQVKTIKNATEVVKVHFASSLLIPLETRFGRNCCS